MALTFPDIDPVAIQIGPLAVRWYALAYIAGILLGWRHLLWLNRGSFRIMSRQSTDDLIVWVMLGIVLGGRSGYVLFYKPEYYLANPLEILFVWEGGMSFHGGLLGVVVSLIVFARRRAVDVLSLGDLIACVAPIGLFLGRIANFINGELFGRPSDVPWAMVFPRGGPVPRHPSQLYEALFEGIILFAVLLAASRSEAVRARPGMLAGMFLLGYGLARSFVELYREPDAFIGFLAGSLTIGQLLSLPMIAAGYWLFDSALRRRSIREVRPPS